MFSHHQTHAVSTIVCITEALSNLRQGDFVFIDIDDTLLLTGLEKYRDRVEVSEPDLARTIAILRESRIPVVGLTARSARFSEQTLFQLNQLKIVCDHIIHAPSKSMVDGTRQMQKGIALQNYLNTLIHKPKRIIIIDDNYAQLENIRESAENEIPLLLYHYIRPHRQAVPKRSDFPESLDEFTQVTSLGGGTRSTYKITNPVTKQSLVLKYGVHPNAIKIEILCNVVYQALGVLVSEMQVYNTLPTALAEALNLPVRHGIFEVSHFITPNLINDKEKILATARQDFIAHVLLGNIDVPKEDNFILSENGQVYLIDAGANFLFRALGEPREEDPYWINELACLKNEELNPKLYQWFSALTREELSEQTKRFASRKDNIEDRVWLAASQLQLPSESYEAFLQCLSARLDQLISQFCPEIQTFAKIDKQAHPEKSAAGILSYTVIDKEICLLLAKRRAHHWWDNFGGKSSKEDTYLYETAIRETAEESSQVLQYTKYELLGSPSHDLITMKDGHEFIYRMYLVNHEPIDTKQLLDDEHTAYQWIPLISIVQALENDILLEVEGQETISITLSDSPEPIYLYPPLYKILKTQPLREHLQRLLLGLPLLNKHTQSQIPSIDKKTHLAGRALVSPDAKRDQISETLLRHSDLICELKEKNKKAIIAPSPFVTDKLSQSELHIKTLLEDKYKENDLAGNIRSLLQEHYQLASVKGLDREQLETLIKQCTQLIEAEKSTGDEFLYFYHGCDSQVAFAYSVYTLLYQKLHESEYWPVFRVSQRHFKKFPTLQHFIAFYSDNGKKEICNDSPHYNDCAFSANVFAFGNHAVPSSCSINYLLTNKNSRDIDLYLLLKNLLQPFSVSDIEIKKLLRVYEENKHNEGGSLYQIAIPRESISKVAYPAGSLGRMNEYYGLSDLNDILKCLEEDLSAKNYSLEQAYPDLTESILLEKYKLAKQYIQSVQARLILPPDHKIKVNKFTWCIGAIDEEKQAVSFKKAIDPILHILLSHANELNMDVLDNNLSLFRVLPSIYKANQLEMLQMNDSLLATAILSNNEELVRHLFEKFPDIRTKKISYPASYIGYDEYDEDKKAVLPIFMILKDSNLSPEFLLTYYGGQWWNNELTIDFIKNGYNLAYILRKMPADATVDYVNQWALIIGHINEWIEVLEAVPESERIKTALTGVHRIKNGSDLVKVTATISENERLSFIDFFRHPKGYIFHSKIKKADELGGLIELLPEIDRLTFAENHQKVIQSYSELSYIAIRLPEKNRVEFIKNNLVNKTIKKNGAHNLLQFFPESERLDVAEQFGQFISEGYDIPYFLFELPDSVRYAFATKFQKKIKNGMILKATLRYLPQSLHLKFIEQNFNLIDNIYILKSILEVLAGQDCLALTLLPCCFNLIRNDFDVMEIINNIPDKDRLSFLLHYQTKICLPASLLVKLPEAERFSFLLLCQGKIENFDHLTFVLTKHIPDEYKIAFVEQHVGVVTGSTLAILLYKLPIEGRFLFIEKHWQIIENVKQLCSVLQELPENNRLIIAENFFDKIVNYQDLVEVLGHLALSHRLAFAEHFNHLIEDGYSLCTVIELLDEQDKAVYAKKHRSALKDWFACILFLLPQNERLAFAHSFQDEITQCSILIEILSKLTPVDGFILAKELTNRIKCFQDFYYVVEGLNEGYRYLFAIEHLDKISKDRELRYLLSLLPDKEKILFREQYDKNALIKSSSLTVFFAPTEASKNPVKNTPTSGEPAIGNTASL